MIITLFTDWLLIFESIHAEVIPHPSIHPSYLLSYLNQYLVSIETWKLFEKDIAVNPNPDLLIDISPEKYPKGQTSLEKIVQIKSNRIFLRLKMGHRPLHRLGSQSLTLPHASSLWVYYSWGESVENKFKEAWGGVARLHCCSSV